jgi:hypothetical protein
MIFDTDVVIWALRGYEKAAAEIEAVEDRAISLASYVEVLRGSRDREEAREAKAFFARQGFRLLPLTENIGHRAAIYMELYGLAVSLDLADVLVAATAVEHGEVLLTGNRKHYTKIPDLQARFFKP